MKSWMKWIMAGGFFWLLTGICGLAWAAYLNDFLTPTSILTTGVGLILLGISLRSMPADGRGGWQKTMFTLAIALLTVGALLALYKMGWLLYRDIYDIR